MGAQNLLKESSKKPSTLIKKSVSRILISAENKKEGTFKKSLDDHDHGDLFKDLGGFLT